MMQSAIALNLEQMSKKQTLIKAIAEMRVWSFESKQNGKEALLKGKGQYSWRPK
jgi:hypothetical protein